MQRYDYLIVGAGLFGSVFAYKATQEGKKCLVIDRKEMPGHRPPTAFGRKLIL